MSSTSNQAARNIPLAVRSPAAPILEPRTGEQYWWERHGTFNPGVAEYQKNIILLYRAYDDFRISRLGLANSQDGVHFTRYDHPAIDTNPDDPHERLGIEDSRITQLGSTYYIVHTSASYHRIGDKKDVRGVRDYIPWRVRIGMHSTEDFHSFQHWGVILPDVPAKNACLLPEKIQGSFGLYYREHEDTRDILKLTYTKDFKHWSPASVVEWPAAAEWQRFKFGIGSQPLATPHGFLTVYHAVDESQVYRLGLLLLSREDPAHILWHSNPILEPEMPYEREGYVPNVVYTCGALIRGQELWVYYGAADRVIGRAVVPLHDIWRNNS
ncbi:MAG: hypothetical protein WEA04_05005 [Candidatus Andersenbacteria bacterium]